MLRKYNPRIVVIVGSVGKTATKDAVYAALAQHAHVRKSEKSFNSEIGLPLTILGRPNAWGNTFRWLQNIFDGFLLIVTPASYPEWLVLEVGADRPGDIRSLAEWIHVDVAVITHLPDVPTHVEYFDSPEQVAEEKASIIKALKKDGTLVLYADHARTLDLASRHTKTITFGFSEYADIRGKNCKVTYTKGRNKQPSGMRMQVMALTSVSYKSDLKALPQSTCDVSVLGVLGSHAMLPILAGIAVGRALNYNLVDVVKALQKYDPPHGRMHIIKGIKDTCIIDDTYNSSPAALSAALDTLSSLYNLEAGLLSTHVGRKIAVVGDMLELGRYSVDEHRKIGAQVVGSADILLTVGFRARDIAEAALDNGMADSAIFQYEDATIAGKELQNILKKGDVVLVKGSQGMRMERAVEEVMAEPDRASEILVRQETQWNKR